MIPFFASRNLTSKDMVEGAPWEFSPGDPALFKVRAMPKAARRNWLSHPTTEWNCYSPLRALNPGLRIAKDNPPVGIRGAAADFDMKTPTESVLAAIDTLTAEMQPQWIEQSIGMKIRLVWVFERELLMPSADFATEFLKAFFAKVGAPTLLAGYDKASERISEVWSNGVDWIPVRTIPVPWIVTFGILAQVAQKGKLFGREEVPLSAIAKEVEAKYPGRWHGEFKEGATGVRFWDPLADCPNGCQVKPDGMLCFTGLTPFMSWVELFGREWVETQRVLQLGNAGKDIYFDDQNYWHLMGEEWKRQNRIDTVLALKNRGLSDKAPKTDTVSDAERVLYHVQSVNRVKGAAPLINFAPGLVQLKDGPVLNTLRLYPVLPAAGAKGDSSEFPWIDAFLNHLLDRDESRIATNSLLAWMQRFYRAMLNHERAMGQTVFMAGPAQSGKTLLCYRILSPLFGGKMANPYAYFTGASDFNDDLFESPLLAINDEEAPKNEAAKQAFQAKLKSFVVNPSHTCHPKFCKKVQVTWVGRIFVSLNLDPSSVGILPEVNDNTADKLMFFASRPYHGGTFPGDVEKVIERELPFFAHWLLNVYQPPAQIVTGDRTDIRSYFDPAVLAMSRQQHHSFNLVELLGVWVSENVFWTDPKVVAWSGTPTDLLSSLSMTLGTQALVRDWSVARIAKSLVTLARSEASGISFSGTSDREFTIKRELK